MKVSINIPQETVEKAFYALMSQAESDDRKILEQAFENCSQDELVDISDDYLDDQKELIHTAFAIAALAKKCEMLKERDNPKNK